MAHARAIPGRLPLEKRGMAQRAKLAQIVDPAARKIVMTELAQVKMRQAITQDACHVFMGL